jgi:hypothetical protein
LIEFALGVSERCMSIRVGLPRQRGRAGLPNFSFRRESSESENGLAGREPEHEGVNLDPIKAAPNGTLSAEDSNLWRRARELRRSGVDCAGQHADHHWDDHKEKNKQHFDATL